MTLTRKAQREARRLRSRRVRAVLAAGLVLGVGATATLAAWNDSEFGSATFSTGKFDITGSTDGTNFAQHAASPGATMTFTVAATASAMTPGDTVYALFSVRSQTDPATMAGRVQLKPVPGNDADLGAYLTYRVKTITGTACNASTFDGGADIAGLATSQPLTTTPTGTQVLNAGGSQINYCFAVTLPTGAVSTAQGKTLNAKWEFAATSTS